MSTQKRGKDAKPRYRRTVREIELEQQIQALSKESTQDGIEVKTLEEDIQAVRDDATAELNEAIEQAKGQNGIEFEPIEVFEDKTIKTESPPINADALAIKVTQQVTKTVLDAVYGELETRTQNILNQVKQATQTKAVVAAIRFNGGDIQKLKREAHPQLVDVLALIKAGLQPLLVGPSGCGKTYLAEQVSEALKLDFGHLCFSAGVSETWLYGRQTPNGFIEGDFARLYREGGVFLADEIDAADSNLLLSLNTALANGHLYNPISGQRVTRHKDFVFVAGANTFGKGGNAQYTGRNRLDAATLNRFTIVEVGYEASVEKKLCPDQEIRERLQSLRKDLTKRGANEVLSYRDFEKATAMKALGWDLNRIIETLTASWPDALKKELVKS